MALGPEIFVFVLALAPRLLVVVRSGGFFGSYGYDAGVYYAAAAGLLHGEVPYRDYVLVHPPMIAYVLLPFAWIGRITSDQTGFITANLAFTVLGAVNAVLVLRTGRQLGLPRRAALIGGLFYALWFGSVGSEFLARLEPLGNFFVLCGVLALVSSWQRTSRVLSILTGCFLALAISVKIWWAVPWLVVLLWQLLARRSRGSTAWMVLGSVVAAVVVNGPPFVLSPAAMWSMVVGAQLGRGDAASSTLDRLADLAAVNQAIPGLEHSQLTVVVGVLGVAVALACVRALLIPQTRLFVLLLVAQLVVLLLGPSWFDFYTDYIAVAASLTVAGAAASLSPGTACGMAPGLASRSARTALGWTGPTLAGALTILVCVTSSVSLVQPVPHHAELARAARSWPCIMSDMPMGLIELNALDRSFEPGCHNWVDVTGRMLGAAEPADKLVRGVPNLVWSKDLADYLLSGDASLPVRRGIGLTGDGRREIQRGGVIVSRDGFTLYRVAK